MADKKKDEGGSNAVSDVFLLLGILAVVVLFWFVSGGPSRTSFEKLFVQSPIAGFGTTTSTTTPVHNWLPFWDPATGGLKTPTIQNAAISGGSASTTTSLLSGFSQFPTVPQLAGYPHSSAANTVTISQSYGVRSVIPEQEYIVLYANPNNASPVTVSGWKVKSAISGKTATIPLGMQVPVLGLTPNNNVIQLNPGDTAVITTGRSPIGISFRENVCAGYFGQFQSFTPPLAQSCPSTTDINIGNNPGLAQDEQCLNAIATLAPCQAAIRAPANVSYQCADYITSHYIYNGCMRDHRNDPNFAGKQWRIYLGQSQELWNNRSDIVALLDAQGNLVSAITY